MDTKGIRAGNIHEGVDFSHPRLGITSVKVDGKSFNMITAHGVELVSEGKMEFKPIQLTPNWLKYFGFKEKVFDSAWRDIKYEITHPVWGCKYEVRFSSNGSGSVAVSSGDTIGSSTVFAWDVDYVHEFQNLFHDLKVELPIDKPKKRKVKRHGKK